MIADDFTHMSRVRHIYAYALILKCLSGQYQQANTTTLSRILTTKAWLKSQPPYSGQASAIFIPIETAFSCLSLLKMPHRRRSHLVPHSTCRICTITIQTTTAIITSCMTVLNNTTLMLGVRLIAITMTTSSYIKLHPCVEYPCGLLMACLQRCPLFCS